jgi:serine/threonine protein phosphatase PrpC
MLNGDKIVQLTQDDSWIATVLPRDTPSLTTHPMRHVLTSAIGARGDVDVDVYERTLRTSDTFLLSTDGLHGALDEEKLALQLVSHGTCRESSELPSPRGTR